ncbi:MAG: GNAT family N-acetyltransferase [Paracoccaceae bacterium]
MNPLAVRDATAEDMPALTELYAQTFPDEDLAPLVAALLKQGDGVRSRVAQRDMQIIGHIAFTLCELEDTQTPVALLGPLAIAPAQQRQGTGRALIMDGLAIMAETGASHVCVLGDPGYYGRFGFEADPQILPPYPIPPEWSEAWQSIALPRASAHPQGKLSVPVPWQDRALWSL